jgi:hypothetical protein
MYFPGGCHGVTHLLWIGRKGAFHFFVTSLSSFKYSILVAGVVWPGSGELTRSLLELFSSAGLPRPQPRR